MAQYRYAELRGSTEMVARLDRAVAGVRGIVWCDLAELEPDSRKEFTHAKLTFGGSYWAMTKALRLVTSSPAYVRP